jgi:hypothetical protein
MMSQHQIVVDDPIRSNMTPAKAARTARKLMRYGVPRWASHPHEFKNYALECYQRDKEQSDAQVADYRMEGQDLLTDRKARLINGMHSRDFIEKLRDNGVNCFTYQVPPGPETPKELLNTVGLWAEVPNERGIGHLYRGIRHQYVCYMDIPMMHEWSLLRLDRHNLPIGEAHRGWRTVVSQLILKKVLTESQAHQIFGAPKGRQSLKYRKTLYEFRNGRLQQNDRRIEA